MIVGEDAQCVTIDIEVEQEPLTAWLQALANFINTFFIVAIILATINILKERKKEKRR